MTTPSTTTGTRRVQRPRWIMLVAPICAAVAYGTLHRLGRTYGSTATEREAVLPGDDLVRDPHVICTHAITIDAAPDRIWPWLLQMGWHRGGWYTARWVDRLLFPANLASSERIIPELQHLDVGDFIPDGPPETECGFLVEQLQPGGHLILRSNSHLPLSWRTRRGARLDWTWVFVLEPLDEGTRTRFVFRWRAHTTPWWCRAFSWAVIVPADFIMSRDMLNGIKARAEINPPGVRSERPRWGRRALVVSRRGEKARHRRRIPPPPLPSDQVGSSR